MASVTLFTPNVAGVDALRTELTRIGATTLNEVWRVLRAWGAEYQRRIKRVVPVETGMLRNHIELKSERTDNSMTVVVGTSFVDPTDGKQYAFYLEYGDSRIAGGRVAAWMPGMPPIMDWPAKMHDIANFRIKKDTPIYRMGKGGSLYYSHTERAAGREGSKKFARSATVAMSAMTEGEGEQMPFLRPIGIEIAPKIVQSLRAVAQGGLDELSGQSF